MAENEVEQSDAGSEASPELRGGAYELIRKRLNTQSKDLRERLNRLNEGRKATFGAVETKLLSSDRVTTDNNCVPRDMVPIGEHFLFGYNVFVGLRPETRPEDLHDPGGQSRAVLRAPGLRARLPGERRLLHHP